MRLARESERIAANNPNTWRVFTDGTGWRISRGSTFMELVQTTMRVHVKYVAENVMARNPLLAKLARQVPLNG